MRLQENAMMEEIFRGLRTLTARRLAALGHGDHAAAVACARERDVCIERLAWACGARGPAAVADALYAA